MRHFFLRNITTTFLIAVFSPLLLADNTAVYAGLNTEKDSNYYYLGGIYALNKDINKTGVTLKAQVALGNYDYRTSGLVDNSVTGKQDRVNLAVGYQWIQDGLLAAAYIGADAQDHNLNPRDPKSDVDGDADGVQTQIEVETLSPSSPYLAFMGNYSTAFETYWTRARGGISRGDTKFGLELVGTGDASHRTEKAGIFTLLPLSPETRMDFSLGYFDTNGEHSREDQDGAYLGAGVTTRF